VALRKWLDGLEHHFQEGGRFRNYYPLFEAVDTIFYTPGHVTRSSAHVRDGVDLKRIMITVWLAAFPAMFYGMYNSVTRPTISWRPPGAAWRAGAVR
jgi:Na+-transporting NADH:ubiquinone oxidoreductase subunit B